MVRSPPSTRSAWTVERVTQAAAPTDAPRTPSAADRRERLPKPRKYAFDLGQRHGADRETEPARLLGRAEGLERDDGEPRGFEEILPDLLVRAERRSRSGLRAIEREARAQVDRPHRLDDVHGEAIPTHRREPVVEQP